MQNLTFKCKYVRQILLRSLHSFILLILHKLKLDAFEKRNKTSTQKIEAYNCDVTIDNGVNISNTGGQVIEYNLPSKPI